MPAVTRSTAPATSTSIDGDEQAGAAGGSGRGIDVAGTIGTKSNRAAAPARSYGVRQVLLSAEQGGRERLVPQLVTNSAAALRRFAEEWDGVVITTAFAVAREVKEGRLIVLEAEPPLLEGAEAHLVTRRGRRLSPAAQKLLRHLRTKVPIILRA